jgi:hypothetical protein
MPVCQCLWAADVEADEVDSFQVGLFRQCRPYPSLQLHIECSVELAISVSIPHALLLGSTLLAWGVARYAQGLLRPASRTLLRGPATPSWLFGHFRVLTSTINATIITKRVEEYGAVFRCYGFLGSVRRQIGHNFLVADQHAHSVD